MFTWAVLILDGHRNDNVKVSYISIKAFFVDVSKTEKNMKYGRSHKPRNDGLCPLLEHSRLQEGFSN